MPLQQLDGPAEGARRPPGVVVAEGDTGAVDQAGPDGAGRPAPVAPQPDHLDARVTGPDQLGRAVGGAVVDHHDRRPLRRAVSRASVPGSSGPRLRVAIPTETGAGVAGMRGGGQLPEPVREPFSAFCTSVIWKAMAPPRLLVEGPWPGTTGTRRQAARSVRVWNSVGVVPVNWRKSRIRCAWSA
jgi:hypothetical protein